jgi:hypothetical protein
MPRRSVSTMRTLRTKGTVAVERVRVAPPGKYWSQLTAVDFMNSSLAFAALAVICGFPFLAVASGATGGDLREAIVARMGLSMQAARDVNRLIAPGHKAVAILTVFSAVLLVAGAIGMASTLQAWYQQIYDQPPVGERSDTSHIGPSGLWPSACTSVVRSWSSTDQRCGCRQCFYLRPDVCVCRSLLVVLSVFPVIPQSRMASALSCWSGNRILHYRPWNFLHAVLLRRDHLRGTELRTRWRRDSPHLR